jgi:hypothetical protein
MTAADFELFDAHPEWRMLLAAYQALHEKSACDWIGRIESLGDLPSDRFSPIHGKLIALGMLRFEINSRADGVHYQVTPMGHQALLAPHERSTSPEWAQNDLSETPAA